MSDITQRLNQKMSMQGLCQEWKAELEQKHASEVQRLTEAHENEVARLGMQLDHLREELATLRNTNSTTARQRADPAEMQAAYAEAQARDMKYVLKVQELLLLGRLEDASERYVT